MLAKSKGLQKRNLVNFAENEKAFLSAQKSFDPVGLNMLETSTILFI